MPTNPDKLTKQTRQTKARQEVANTKFRTLVWSQIDPTKKNFMVCSQSYGEREQNPTCRREKPHAWEFSLRRVKNKETIRDRNLSVLFPLYSRIKPPTAGVYPAIEGLVVWLSLWLAHNEFRSLLTYLYPGTGREFMAFRRAEPLASVLRVRSNTVPSICKRIVGPVLQHLQRPCGP